MKKIIILVMLFLSTIFYGQQSYNFNYMFIYNEVTNKNKNVLDYIYLVNSLDNSYNIIARENENIVNNDEYSLFFIDFNKCTLFSSINRGGFYQAKKITAGCSQYSKLILSSYENGDNYKYQNFNDTLINDTTYYHYALKSTRAEKYIKNHKLTTTHYIVYKKTDQFLPFTNVCFPYYFIWKKKKNIPNGYVKLRYVINSKKEQISKIELRKVIKIDKTFEFPKDCDY